MVFVIREPHLLGPLCAHSPGEGPSPGPKYPCEQAGDRGCAVCGTSPPGSSLSPALERAGKAGSTGSGRGPLEERGAPRLWAALTKEPLRQLGHPEEPLGSSEAGVRRAEPGEPRRDDKTRGLHLSGGGAGPESGQPDSMENRQDHPAKGRQRPMPCYAPGRGGGKGIGAAGWPLAVQSKEGWQGGAQGYTNLQSLPQGSDFLPQSPARLSTKTVFIPSNLQKSPTLQS